LTLLGAPKFFPVLIFAMGETLYSSRCGFVPVMFRVKLGRLRGMVGCVVKVALRGVSVVSRSLMVASFVMLRRFMMMLGGMFVVLCCLAMVFCCFLGHIVLLIDDLLPKKARLRS